MTYLHEIFGIEGDWERGGNYFFIWDGCIIASVSSVFWREQFTEYVPSGTVCYAVPDNWFEWQRYTLGSSRVYFEPEPDFETRLVTGMILGEVERRVR